MVLDLQLSGSFLPSPVVVKLLLSSSHKGHRYVNMLSFQPKPLPSPGVVSLSRKDLNEMSGSGFIIGRM